MGLLCSVRGGAVDVGSAAALRDALGNATVSGNVVMLTGDVSLSSTLNITGGDDDTRFEWDADFYNKK